MLQVGCSGADVGALQQQLVEAGGSIAAGELVAAIFGPSTKTAVEDFQARHVGPDGHALVADGIVGSSTGWALENPGSSGAGARYTVAGWRCSPSDARRPVSDVLAAAVAEISAHEIPDGSNRGPRVDVYTGLIGQPSGSGPPWCAYFASWCWARAEGGAPFPPLASALKFREWGAAHARLVAAMPMPGDVGVILRGDLHGHVVLVAAVLGDGKIATIEGNSGNAVRGLVRDVTSFAAFVRPVGDLA